ncbi:glyoxylase-like metal-dependent hydrolase (beta-lactamase superfamily II) [Rhodopseudomonas thermotolerans]|uniref:Glyoxylase-like metal-dependent hydrolase (Beta-lactamase superfamily II) n=2 Tax=Rhodopseudomonas TaxID=1073 RepID=A0A336JYA8_9BRAD|nr:MULTISPECIES: MBL fold metallo-hydrolase [Rhodopseudomonas]RED24203.1 glyoxylase-like metal-dependent hydrolase (beta-lactamase superfamily II) [Rhodopseudomonas pentothenatexigens]REF90266.1 glyoxylase-like metal-dependent hydrolase (beta-lactamase superfamily II) [Rhodopseudomonas thermotolerans]SSW93299.1 glyoxylase-like metal-dependent hydrolase (beta-lactamase superfamily II) [Rhodopseudomonas pentothenatexigens]
MAWTIGKVKITKIVEMEMTGGTRFILPQAPPQEIQTMPWLTPQFASAEGRLTMSIHSWVVETPTRRIVVDTGLGNDKQGRGVPHWNGLDKPFLQDLANAGYAADSIDTVICTHLHVDHVGWNTRLVNGQWVPTFPNARYLFGRIEYEYWKTHSTDPVHAAVFADSVQPVIEAGVVELVGSEAQIADEITLIPTPGHSPGHVALHIRSDGEEAVLSGDVAHHPCQMARLDWSSSFDSDPLQSIESRRQLFSRFAETPALLFGGHFGPGRIVRDGDAFRLVPLQ